MIDIFKQFATDEAAEDNGTWKEIGPESSIKVARAGNDEYNEAISKEATEHRLALEIGGKASKALNNAILARVMAKTILKDWKGLSYRGKPIDYSLDNAAMLLGHKEFRELVSGISNDFRNYMAKEEVEQGNT